MKPTNQLAADWCGNYLSLLERGTDVQLYSRAEVLRLMQEAYCAGFGLAEPVDHTPIREFSTGETVYVNDNRRLSERSGWVVAAAYGDPRANLYLLTHPMGGRTIVAGAKLVRQPAQAYDSSAIIDYLSQGVRR